MDKIKLQYFSDVHTEFYVHEKNYLNKLLRIIKPVGDFLILAGDIGNPDTDVYKYFLSKLSEKFVNKTIILVSGNHEHYNTNSSRYLGDNWMENIDTKIRQVICNLPNIKYLQNEVFCIPDSNICFYGSTLWSNIRIDEEEEVISKIKDYIKIPGFTINNCRNLHCKSIELLTYYIEHFYDKNFIVVTHHLPSFNLIDHKYSVSNINSAFATDINLELTSNPRIIKWFAGHTHHPVEYGKFHVNPIGYKNENFYIDFNKTCLIKTY